MKKTLKLAIAALSMAMLPALAQALVTATPTAPVIAFNPATVGVAAGSAQTLTATFAVSGYTGSFTPTAALHYGHDYSAGAVNCTSTGASTENCSVSITFQPTLPGGRKDAIFLSDPAGPTRLATVLLGGVGQAPLALMQPGVVTNMNPNVNYDQYNVAIDENGTAYVVSENSSAVYSVTPAGVATKLPLTLSGGPWGIAIDGAGMLYIAQNTYSHTLITYDTVAGVAGSLCVAPPSLGLSCSSTVNNEYMIDVAVDHLGNIFTTEILSNNVFELKPDGSYVTTAISPGITQIAVDSADNIFVSGYTINEIPNGGTQVEINTVGGSEGIAVDAAETLYPTRYLVSPYDIAMLPASDYTKPLAGIDGGAGGAVSPLGLGLGSDGTLYVGNYSELDKVDRTQGAIALGETPLNTATTARNVGVYNGGNENLTLASVEIAGTGFTFQNSALTDACVDGQVLAPGQLCQVGVTATFTHAGSYTGSVTFTSNSLNTASTVQTVALSALVYGPYVTTPTTALTFGSQNTGTSTTQTVTITNNGYYYGATVGISSATVPSGFSISTPASGSNSCYNGMAPGVSCQITVTFDPSLAQVDSGTVTVGIGSPGGGGPWPSVTFTVSGTGVTPAPIASLSPALSFPSTNAGSTATALAATLSNTGSASLTGITPSITGTNPGDFAVTTGSNACGSTLAAGSTCSIYITFTPASAASFTATLSVADNATPSPQTVALTGTGVSFVSNVGDSLAAQPVTVEITTAGTPSSIQVLTQGTASLDFTGTAGGTCTTATAYIVGQTCTVNVVFDPLHPGARNGAVVLTDGSGVVLGTTYVPGTGNGPQTIFADTTTGYYLPSMQASIAPAAAPTSDPIDLAVDAAGNVYVADAVLNVIDKYVAVNGVLPASPTMVSLSGNFNSPSGVAIDGAGNIFVADYSNGVVKEMLAAGNYTTVNTLCASCFNRPNGVAIDGAGNLFVVDSSNSAVYELSPANGYATTTTLGSGFNLPTGIAVDSNGNVFVADRFNGEVKEILAAGGYTAIKNLGGGFSRPTKIALDAAGNVFVADDISAYLQEILATGGYSTTIRLEKWTGAGAAIYAVAVDGSGNLYVAPGATNAVQFLSYSTPPALTFASTTVGSTSSDSPQTVRVFNDGNASLTFSSSGTNPNYPVDFPVNSSDTNLCAAGSVLTAGSNCDASIKFTPTAGTALSEYLVLTDNNLNGSGITQSIAVSGTGIQQPTVATPVISPGTGAYSNYGTVTITDGTTGAVICYTTTAGSTPAGSNGVCTSGSTYTGSFNMSAGLVIQAIGTLAGDTNSALASANYTLQAAPPTMNPPGGTYVGSQSVTLSTTTTAATIWYTTDGSTPTGSAPSIRYNVGDSSTPIAVTTSGTVINAITVDDGMANSSVATATYTLQFPAASLTAPSAFTASAGTTSTAQAATLQNTGSAPLTGITTSITGTNPGDFAVTTGSNACGSTLAAGASCSIYVTFTPAGGSAYSATLSVADNAATSPQTVALTGTGVLNSQSISFTQPTSPVTYASGLTVPLVATGGASGNAVVFTIDASSTGTGSISGSTLTVTGAGSLVIDANQAGNTSYAAATQAQRTVQITQAAQSISFTQPASPQTYASGLTIPLAATGGASGNAVVFTIDEASTGNGSISGSTLTVTGAGTFVIDANQASSTDYSAATQVQQTIVVQAPVVPADFSLTPSPASQSVAVGGSAAYTISAASVSGSFTTPIVLSVSGLPAGATAVFSPASITLGGESSNTSTLTVNTATQSVSNQPAGIWPIGVPALALLVLIPMRRWRRLWRGKLLIFLTAILTLAATLSLSACGGGFGFPTTSHSYTLTITGTGGSTTHTATVQLTVQE